MSILITFLKMIFVLGFLVLIHEGGHFFVAKKCGVKVNEFAIGFGPTILSKQGKETKYAIRLIPLGGFVNLEGEEERIDSETSFSSASAPKRIAILAAGGLVNIIFAVLAYFILILCVGEFQSTKVEYVVPEIQNQGLQVNDEILKINNKKIGLTSDITEILSKNKNEKLDVVVKRDKKNVNLKITPFEQKTSSIGVVFKSQGDTYTTEIASLIDDNPAQKAGLQIGDKITKINNQDTLSPFDVIEKLNEDLEKYEVTITVQRNQEKIDFTVKPNIVESYSLGIDLAMAENNILNRLYYSTLATGKFLSSALDGVKMLFTGKVGVEQLTGPIGIGKVVSQAEKIQDFIELLILISLSLGVTNLLPFPPLDGGKIVLVLIEVIRRKPLKENIEVGIQMVGFGLMIILSIFVAYSDIFIKKM